MKTVPTGFSGEPPLGPAMPSPRGEVRAVSRAAPSAISRATGSLTAPWAASVSARTPRKCAFAALL